MQSLTTITTTDNGAEFLSLAGGLLNLNEASNNTLISVATSAQDTSSQLAPPYWFAMATSDDGKQSCAVHANPDGLVLADMPTHHCIALTNDLLRKGIVPTRIYGPQEVAEVAAKIILTETGISMNRAREWRAYEHCVESGALPCGPGILRKAHAHERDLVHSLGRSYGDESPTIVDVADYFVTKLIQGDLFLWVDDRTDVARSAIALSGRSNNVVRIAGVFTPKEFRGQGHAFSAVSAITEQIHQSGYRTVTLVVDRSDKASTSMYEKLGYLRIHDRVEMVSSIN